MIFYRDDSDNVFEVLLWWGIQKSCEPELYEMFVVE
jgi:hypothetical protein